MRQRLIILTPGFPLDEADTNCLPAEQRLLRGLQREAPELELIVLSFQYPFRRSRYQWEGIPVIAFGGRNRGGLLRRWLWRRVRQTLCQLIEEKPCTLLSFWYDECAALGEDLSKKYGVRHICWMRGQDARAGNSYVHSHPIPAERLLAISDAQADVFETNYGYRPGLVLPNAIDRGTLEQNRHRPIHLLGVGSLIPLKQFGVFIEVIAQLQLKFPLIRAFLCGSGPEEAALKRRVRELGLDNCIEFLGEVPNGAVQQLMRHSRILLHPSSYEGFSTVCLEALAGGAHVVSFHQPMREETEHWHIVASMADMSTTCGELLAREQDHEARYPYSIPEVIRQLLPVLGWSADRVPGRPVPAEIGVSQP